MWTKKTPSDRKMKTLHDTQGKVLEKEEERKEDTK
jgi:hypothetical protein